MRLAVKLGLLAAALALSAPTYAARVTPMSVDLSTSGRDSATRIEFTNTEDRELPVEIRMYHGVISESGELQLEPADDKFLAFPPQVVMQPKTQQIFRVQYLPSEPLSKSEIYYAAISQVPVKLDPTVSKIQLVMRFNVLVNVVPDGAKPDAAVSWAKPTIRKPIEEMAPEETAAKPAADPAAPAAPAPTEEKGIEVRIENKGNRYFAAGRTNWTVTGTTAAGQPFSRSYTPSQIGSEIGMGVVPPGGARVFFVELGEALADGSVNVTIDK